MIHFEADPGQGGPPAPEPAPGPAPEPYPAPEAVPAPAAEPTVPAGLSLDSPELQGFIDNRAAQMLEAQLAPLFEQAAAYEEPPAAPAAAPVLDPLSDTFGQDLQQLLASERAAIVAAVKQEMATISEPLQQQREAAQMAQGEQLVQDIFAENIARLGDFPADPETGHSAAKDSILPLAAALLPEFTAKFGNNAIAVEQAITAAAQRVREIGNAYSRQGVNRETTRLTAIAGARGEPGAAGQGGYATRPEPRTPSEVTARYAAEARRLHADGHS